MICWLNHNCIEINNTFLSCTSTKDLDFFIIFLSFAFGTRQRNSIYRIIYWIHQRNSQQQDNWYTFSINVKLKFVTWFDFDLQNYKYPKKTNYILVCKKLLTGWHQLQFYKQTIRWAQTFLSARSMRALIHLAFLFFSFFFYAFANIVILRPWELLVHVCKCQ